MPALRLIHGQALPLPPGDRADLLAARQAGCEIIGRPTIGAAP